MKNTYIILSATIYRKSDNQKLGCINIDADGVIEATRFLDINCNNQETSIFTKYKQAIKWINKNNLVENINIDPTYLVIQNVPVNIIDTFQNNTLIVQGNIIPSFYWVIDNNNEFCVTMTKYDAEDWHNGYKFVVSPQYHFKYTLHSSLMEIRKYKTFEGAMTRLRALAQVIDELSIDKKP